MSSDQSSRPQVNFQTFGCKVNTYDTGLLQKRLNENNFHALLRESTGSLPDIHILNTCAVTAEATQEALRRVRKLRREKPQAFIVVTGCSAQVDTEKWEQAVEADLVVANSHKGQLEELIAARLMNNEITGRIHKSNIFKKDDLEEGGGVEEGHTRSFLKIQDGCNSFCTFCVIPFARGKSRSLTVEQIVFRVNELLAQDVQEIVLTGVHIGDYEFGLENLIEEILAQTKVQRLRLTSLEPIEVTPRLLDLFSDKRLCPHFHMSIQSASTTILQRMKRKYTSKEVSDSLIQIQQKVPHAFVGMDVIVGFPGEGESEFLETYQRLESLPWSRIHVFPYSERPGTYAVRLDGKNPMHVVRRFADRLRELSHLRFENVAKAQRGLVKQLLILGNGQGLSRDYWSCDIEDFSDLERENLRGQEIPARVVGFEKSLHGDGRLKVRKFDV